MNTPNNSNSPVDDDQSQHSRSLMEVIFGSKLKDTNISEGAIERALEFKVEQERTKQQYYKLENINRSIELFKLARDLGVPPKDISGLFSTDTERPSVVKNGVSKAPATAKTGRSNSVSTGAESLSRQPLSYRFPPAGSNLLPRPVPLHNGVSRRTNSPARIGASAVAALNDSVTIKEEDTQCAGSPFARKSTYHNRNLSLPITKLNNATIPSGMTSILSFNRENLEATNSTSQALTFSSAPTSNNSHGSNSFNDNSNSSSSVRKSSMVTKKHRRTRSASSFGVIDLNVIDEAKKQDIERSRRNENKSGSEKHHEYDEKTCSESSSRNESPVRAITSSDANKTLNPVAKILNST